MTGAGLLLAVIALLVYRARDLPLAPAVPTLVPATKTAIATPSRTFTPAPPPSRAVTFTPSPTATPHLPLALEIMVVSTVTPQASASISYIVFSDTLLGGLPVGRRYDWFNPIPRMYVSFIYSHMTYGAHFAVLWFRNGELVYQDSGSWELGGHGRTAFKYEPALHEWHPGEYEVQFYVGTIWKATGRFTLTGNPPTQTFTPTSSPTWTSSPLPSETPTATPTK